MPQWTRRGFLGLAAATAASAAAGRLLGESPPRKRPNVLFLFADDLRFSTIHALGCREIQTPNIDSLVTNGTAFTHQFIMGGTNGAICICSRACLMSGRTLWRAPLNLPPELALWPAVMKGAGYATFGTGKWHNGPQAFARGFSAGGEIFFGGMCNHLKVPAHDFDPSGRYGKDTLHTGGKFSSELFSDAAVKFLMGYKEDKPFFMYVAYTAPHDPRMAPRDWADKYAPDKIPLPPNYLPEHPFDNGELKVRDEKLLPWPRTPQAVRGEIAAYYAMIAHLDDQIGRVLSALKQSGHADDTIIIFSGDNGLAVGQHGLLGKQNLYEHSVRTPLIFAGPGIPKGQQRDGMVYLHDMFPTVCELAGIPVPRTVEGVSYAPMIADPAAPGRPNVFAAYRHCQRMVRTERWKLIHYPKIGKTQLFDIVADPWELKDLSGLADQAGRVKELSALLGEWQKKTDDPLLSGRGEEEPKFPAAPQAAVVKPAADGSLTLRPQDAHVVGTHLRYQSDRDNLGGWTDPGEYAQWQLAIGKAGPYEVEFTYGCVKPDAQYVITAGGQSLEGKTVDTEGLKTYMTFKPGLIDLPAGPVTVAVKPKGRFQGALMNFRLLKLTPRNP